MRRPLRGRFALFASWLTGAVALVSLFATGNAAADGYNTWPGGLVALGELEISPQWQVALPYRDASSSPLMLQAGLAELRRAAKNLDIIDKQASRVLFGKK